MPSLSELVALNRTTQNTNQNLMTGALTPMRLSDIRENRDLAQEQVRVGNQAQQLQNKAMIQKIAEQPFLRNVRLKAAQGDTFAGQGVEIRRIYLAAIDSNIRIAQIICNNQ